MRSIKRKWVVIFSLFLVVGFVFFHRTRTDTQTPPSPTKTTGIPTPKTRSYISFDDTMPSFLPISFDLSPEPFIPSMAPVYELSTAGFSEEMVSTIARNLGMDIERLELKDPFYGKLYLYSKEKETLRIYPDKLHIEYKRHNLTEEEIKLDNTGFAKKALSFLTDNGFVQNTDSISFRKGLFVAIRHEGIVETLPPNTYSLSFAFMLNNTYPVFGPTYDTGSVNVVFNTEGEVYRVLIDNIPEFTSETNHSLLSLEQLKTLAPSKASIQSADNGNLQPFDIDRSTIKQIVITKVEIGYLKELAQEQKYLQPIFHLTGKITFKNGSIFEVGLYMPALAQN